MSSGYHVGSNKYGRLMRGQQSPCKITDLTRLTSLVCFIVWAVIFSMGFVPALALHVRSARLSQSSTVLTLRDWSTFLVHMDKGTICETRLVFCKNARDRARKLYIPYLSVDKN